MSALVNGYRLVSNSEIQAFKKCRRKWYLEWHRGLVSRKREVQGIRSTGTRLHIALEARYQPGTLGSRDVVLSALRTAQEADIAVLVQRGTTTEEIAALQKDFTMEMVMIQGYMEWLAETGEDSDLEVVASESFVEAVLPEVSEEIGGLPPVKIIGKLDLRVLDRRTGKKKFMDHKSVGTFKVPMLRSNQQILHYELLELLDLDDPRERSAGVYYNMLRRVLRTGKAKPPFFKRVEIVHNQTEMSTYRQHLVGVITDIQQVERALNEDRKMLPLVAYPTPSRDCDWMCAFRTVCPMFDDGSRVDSAVDNLFEQTDPLAYYQGKEKEVSEE